MVLLSTGGGKGARFASGEYDLLILDELTYAVSFGWVVDGIRGRDRRTDVVVTGRDAGPN
jgi:cob(I)alamin adenosyltransferase